MIAIPALDVRKGRCVQLVGGRPEDERISLPDPLGVAVRWRTSGFESLHVVDLDAALGSGENFGVVTRVLDATDVEVQVGGGIRSAQQAGSLLEYGADRIVVGTRALDDPRWLSGLAHRWPGQVVVALDAREGRVLRKGWTEQTARNVEDFLPTLASLPLAGVLSTDVAREGRLEGIDRASCARVIEASPHPVCISGGITTIDELTFLEDAGAHAAVLGMAIYTGALDIQEVAARWGARATDGDTAPDTSHV